MPSGSRSYEQHMEAGRLEGQGRVDPAQFGRVELYRHRPVADIVFGCRGELGQFAQDHLPQLLWSSLCPHRRRRANKPARARYNTIGLAPWGCC